MKATTCAVLALAALPALAAAESAPADTRSMEQRQQDLEKQVEEQGAHIRELERMLREALSAKSESASGAAAAVPAAASSAAAASAGTGPTQSEEKLTAEAARKLSVTNPTYEFIGPAEVQGPEADARPFRW